MIICSKLPKRFYFAVTSFGLMPMSAFMQKIEHIGIAVKDLSIAIPLYESLLNTPCYKKEMVESEKVQTAFFQTGESKVELLQSTDADGVIARFIDKKGEGFHQVAFGVEDIESEIQRLKAAGFQFISEAPKKGADDMLVCFLHPKSTGGVLVEICQKIQP